MNKVLIVTDVIMVIVVVWFHTKLPPQIPLYYSRPWGDLQLADAWAIALLPFLLHVSIMINNILYRRLFYPDDFIVRFVRGFNTFLVIAYSGIFIRLVLFIS